MALPRNQSRKRKNRNRNTSNFFCSNPNWRSLSLRKQQLGEDMSEMKAVMPLMVVASLHGATTLVVDAVGGLCKEGVPVALR